MLSGPTIYCVRRLRSLNRMYRADEMPAGSVDWRAGVACMISLAHTSHMTTEIIAALKTKHV